MAYSNAVFYLDPVNGVDTARADLVPSAYSDNGAGLVRVTVNAHTLVDGAVFTVGATCTRVSYRGDWKVTVPDNTHLDLVGSTYVDNPATKGTGIPFGGCSWADAWKTLTTGATALRIAPGDEIRIAKSPAPTSLGQNALWGHPTWRGNTPAATVAISSSTNATPIVITKNGHGLTNGKVVKIINHATNTNANGVWVVANKTDNTYELEGSVGNGVGGATGTYQDVSPMCVVLTTPVTVTIDNCESNWTAGTNVTSANTDATVYRQFLKSIKVITAAGHAGAGIIAKFGLPTALDLSGYEQVSFWFRNETSALAAAGDMKLKLYHDQACTDEHETFDLPAIPSTATWVCITLDKGSALNAVIQGVALYANIAMASKTFYIDGIIACKDASTVDSLTLQSLISKNTLEQGASSDTGANYASEGWYGIQSIDGRIIVLDNTTGTLPFSTSHKGYVGVAESVTLYKRETIKTALVSGGSTTVQSLTDDGTSGNVISFKGGYNTSGPNTQDGETLFDGLNGRGYSIQVTGRSYILCEKISHFRYGHGYYGTTMTGTVSLNIPDANNNTADGLYLGPGSATSLITMTVRNANMNGSIGVNYYNGGLSIPSITRCMGNGSHGLQLNQCYDAHLEDIGALSGNGGCGLNLTSSVAYSPIIDLITETNHNATAGVQIGYFGVLIKELLDTSANVGPGIQFNQAWDNRILSSPSITDNGGIGGVYQLGANSMNNHVMSGESSANVAGLAIADTCLGNLFVSNFTNGDGTPVATIGNSYGSRIISTNNGKDSDSHWVWDYLGTLNSQTAVRNTASGIAWLIQPNANSSAILPLRVPLVTVACEANKLVTVVLHMRRSDTKLTLGMRLKGGQLPGATLANDIITPMTSIADTWEDVTFTFTPTQRGVVEIDVYTFRNTAGGTYLGYYDDLEISQAD
jgi:hypothetical protein